MNVSVLGFGTVGQGVWQMLQKAEGFTPVSVLVRPGKADEPFKVTEIREITENPAVDAVVEVIGGIEPAKTWVSAALCAGKHVVTANKALVAAHGLELAALAREHNAAFLFSAACGGAVPFLHNLSLAAKSDRIESLGGILNGTTNYMLDAMQRRELDYADALKQAQALGYAEADPTADVSGLDALRKLKLACAAAFSRMPEEGLCLEGIENFRAHDAANLQSLDLVCRLLVRAWLHEGSLCAFAEPCLLPQASIEGTVFENYNLARYRAKNAGDIILIGQGAGRFPTASAVLRDLSDIQQGARDMLPADCVPVTADCSALRRYYVRLDSKYADLFPIRLRRQEGDFARLVTEPIPVRQMHETAQKLRAEGCRLFFAGVEDRADV